MKIPNRACVEKASEFYLAPNIGTQLVVSLDGRRITEVVEYDVEGGWLRRYKTTALGTRYVDKFKQPVINTLNGVITVVWRDDAPAELREGA